MISPTTNSRALRQLSLPASRIAVVRFITVFTVVAQAAILSGCFLLKEPVDVRALRLSQAGVESLPSREAPGRLKIDYAMGDFQVQSLELPPGEYTIVVANVDYKGDIGFFLSKPDRYGREADSHVAVGGGISLGESSTFEVTFDPGATYFFSEPILSGPTHQIVVGEDTLLEPEPEPVATEENVVEEIDSGMPEPLDVEELNVEELGDEEMKPRSMEIDGMKIEIPDAAPSDMETPKVESIDGGEAEPAQDAEDRASDEPSTPELPKSNAAPAEESSPDDEPVLSEDAQNLLDAYFRAEKRENEQ